jgi:heterodisulfide reductase subunit C
MVDFGFGLLGSSRINLDLFDGRKFEKLAAIEPDVRKCIACGSCTAVCTAGQFTPTSLRAAIEELQNGRENVAMDMLSGCQLCGKCMMVCPRGINTRHLILSISKIYSKKDDAI